jgi:hypothetical protein
LGRGRAHAAYVERGCGVGFWRLGSGRVTGGAVGMMLGMRRGSVTVLVAVVVAAVLGAPTLAGETGASDLLQRYEPVLLFHPEEDWAPSRVESYLGVARVERQVGKGLWALVAPPLPTASIGCVLDPCYRLNLPCALRGGVRCYEDQADAAGWREPVVYGTVAAVPASASPPPGFTQRPRYLLHYWLFYGFDDWHSIHRRLWQTHEADWESITVGIGADDRPQFAAYSEHCSGSVRPWSAVATRGGSHPVAYVALGSHANWFSSATVKTNFSECIKGGRTAAAATKAARLVRLAQERVLDRMGSAHASGPSDLPGVTPLQLIELVPATTAWARFPGRWGEGQILWIGSKPRSLTTVAQGYGPGTPRWGATSVSASWHPATG